MKYRQLGSTFLRVSVIGIGTWQLGGEWGHDYTQDEADAIFEAGAAAGINLIDTAECYGDHVSERLIGDYCRRHDRGRWIIATKFGHRFRGFWKRDDLFSADAVREQLEESLRALQTDCIDLYQFHSGSDDLFRDEALWAMLKAQKAAGKIKHLGVSILAKGSEFQAAHAREAGAEALQVFYNRLDRRPEEIYFPHAEKDRLGVLARVPLASGLLSGKYQSAQFPADDVRSTFDPAKMEKDVLEAQRIQKTEVPPGVPMAQWALAWCLKNPLVSAVIPGCKNPAQVQANAAAVKLLA